MRGLLYVFRLQQSYGEDQCRVLYVSRLDDWYENLRGLVYAEDLWGLLCVFRLQQSYAEDQWDLL